LGFFSLFPASGWSDAGRLVRRVSLQLLAVTALACSRPPAGDGPTAHGAAASAPATAPAGVILARSSPPVAPGPSKSETTETVSKSVSVGRPNRGALYNGVLMTDGPHWAVVNPQRAFGTEETVASITSAISAVVAAFPDSPKLYVGDISGPRGGYIRPHHSHQSGRDVDLGLYYAKGSAWFVRARADNLDRARSWTLLRALIDDPNVEMIFLDRSIQRLLKEYAVKAGESRERLDALFEERTAFSDKLIRHEWGHLTHLHVRFKCPKAVEAGERATRAVALAPRTGRAKYY
jgi:murein endopeptidase